MDPQCECGISFTRIYVGRGISCTIKSTGTCLSSVQSSLTSSDRFQTGHLYLHSWEWRCKSHAIVLEQSYCGEYTSCCPVTKLAVATLGRYSSHAPGPVVAIGTVSSHSHAFPRFLGRSRGPDGEDPHST